MPTSGEMNSPLQVQTDPLPSCKMVAVRDLDSAKPAPGGTLLRNGTPELSYAYQIGNERYGRCDVYCANCGAKLEEDQSFCSACGKQTGTPPPAGPAPSALGRVTRHLQIVAILWVVYSLLRIIGGLGALFFGSLRPLFSTMNHMPFGFGGWLLPWMTFVGFVSLVYATAGIAAGLGLFERKQWARILALVVSILALIQFPVGTALGIYSLWVLLPLESREQYQRMSAFR